MQDFRHMRPVQLRQTCLLMGLLLFCSRLAIAQLDPQMLYQQALNEYGMRHLKEARRHFETLIRDHPKHPLARRASIELARILTDMREFDKAIEKLTPLAESTEASYERKLARDALLKLLADLQRFKPAVDLLEKWRAEDQNDLVLARRLADFYLQTGREDEARTLLEGLLERTADREVFRDLLQLAVRSGRLENLLNTIEGRAVRYRRVDYLEFAGDCLLALRREKEAVDLLREAPETRQNPLLLAKLARLLLSRNEIEPARDVYEQLVAMSPDNREYRRALGHCLHQLKRTNEAMAVWRGIFGQLGISQLEAYQFLLDTLIEHRLYEESLEVFQEARAALGNFGLFAEEKAGVLMTLGRESEAIDEYLLALPAGGFKIDIFDKLYGYHGKKVDLEQKLRDLMAGSDSFYAARRALIELYFREGRTDQIAKVVALAQGGMSDDMLYERIQQALSTQADGFVRKLIVSLIQQFYQSSLAWRLAPALLELPDQTPEEQQEAKTIAATLASRSNPPDFLLRRRLLVSLAAFHLNTLSDPQGAADWLRQAEAITAGGTRREAFQIQILACRLHTLQGRFTEAENCLARLRGLMNDPTTPKPPAGTDPWTVHEDEDTFIMSGSEFADPIGGELTAEDRAQFLYTEAWVLAHKGEYQPALTKLRSIIDEYPSSFWINDALALALEITMGSIGNMEALGKLLGAERAAGVGSYSAALELYDQVRQLASGTSLAPEAEARHILLSERTASPTGLISRIDTFRKTNPAHLAGADLLLLKYRLQKRLNISIDIGQQTLREFLDRYPGDLRGRRVSRLLQGSAESGR